MIFTVYSYSIFLHKLLYSERICVPELVAKFRGSSGNVQRCSLWRTCQQDQAPATYIVLCIPLPDDQLTGSRNNYSNKGNGKKERSGIETAYNVFFFLSICIIICNFFCRYCAPLGLCIQNARP